MTLIELLQKHDEGDFLRAVTEAVLQTLMEHDVEGVIGAGRYLQERRADTAAALSIADRIEGVVSVILGLFPFGLDLDAMRRTLDFGPAIFAIRGNLPDGYRPPEALLALKRVCDGSALPVMIELGNLATAIGHAARALPLCRTDHPVLDPILQ